jgi:hypothetical protein
MLHVPPVSSSLVISITVVQMIKVPNYSTFFIRLRFLLLRHLKNKKNNNNFLFGLNKLQTDSINLSLTNNVSELGRKKKSMSSKLNVLYKFLIISKVTGYMTSKGSYVTKQVRHDIFTSLALGTPASWSGDKGFEFWSRHPESCLFHVFSQSLITILKPAMTVSSIAFSIHNPKSHNSCIKHSTEIAWLNKPSMN